MGRDHRKLRVFGLADQLVVDVYRATQALPPGERFGLQSQIRRSTVSAAVNIVEGCTRRTTSDYLHFLTVSLGSASEARYLLELAARLEMIPANRVDPLVVRFSDLVRGLQKLIDTLEPRPGRSHTRNSGPDREAGFRSP
ncbi:MAG: four helix bundle protein [Alphaproteobacteria bacterium]|nr:four helix bundle protein [Alphaproteobacteria bacterium]MCB9697188.1 four helix bundle protein [Alphaproteobacteria bacterium]